MNGCRQCPAFAKCTADIVYLGSRCAALRSAYGVESDPEILTNADRIRAMSDEELAEWAINEAPKIGYRYTNSEIGLLQWLKQPAEEEQL